MFICAVLFANPFSPYFLQLSVTLDDETNNKIKSYALKRSDCDRMTLGQLQLILNDMHSKKQGKRRNAAW